MAIYACQQGPVSGDDTSDLQLFQCPGIDGKYQKSILNPTQLIGFLGFQINSQTMRFNLTSEKSMQKDTAGSSKSAQISVNVSTTPSNIYGEGCGNLQSCCAGPLTLQRFAEGTKFHTFQEHILTGSMPK